MQKIKQYSNVGIGANGQTKKLSINGTIDAFVADPSAVDVVLNTTGENLTVSSAAGSAIIRLG